MFSSFGNVFGSKSSFVQCNSNGNTIVINGKQYASVTRVILETVTHERIAVPGEYNAVKIRVDGNCGRIETQSGDVTVEGECLDGVKTMSGSVTIAKNCNNSVSTMSGSVEVGGKVKGSVTTMSGSIRHAVHKLVDKTKKKKQKPVKVEKQEELQKSKKRESVTIKDEEDDSDRPEKKVKRT